jgi:hypothetical protein
MLLLIYPSALFHIGPPESLPSAVPPRVVSGVPSGDGAEDEFDASEVSLWVEAGSI